MKRPGAAFVLALVSLILCPILIFVEFTAAFFAAMVNNESANPAWVKVLTIALVVLIALVGLVFSLFVMRNAIKSRAGSKLEATGGSGLATVALVIAVIAFAGYVLGQVYMILATAGICGLDGC